MSDVALDELDGKTPLQVADHRNMDILASKGVAGLLETIPSDKTPGTEVALMSIFGYDPRLFNPTKKPLEATGLGVDLGKHDLALRCNFETSTDGILKDHSAGHITTKEARVLLEVVKEHYGKPGLIEFHNGVGYRNLLVMRGARFSNMIVSIPPHDAINLPVQKILVKAANEEGVFTANTINDMILNSELLLRDHPVNIARIEAGENPGNMIWPWGQGFRPNIKTLRETYGIKGAVISAVNIVKGIGRYLGMSIVNVPGATGYFDTNYEGKADYALKSLKDNDLVLVHVESPDEASHKCDCKLKVKTIEDLDSRLIGRLLNGLIGDYTIVILADHTTQTNDGSHSNSPVPFALFSTQSIKSDNVTRFDEVAVRQGSLGVIEGSKFMRIFLEYGGKIT